MGWGGTWKREGAWCEIKLRDNGMKMEGYAKSEEEKEKMG